MTTSEHVDVAGMLRQRGLEIHELEANSWIAPFQIGDKVRHVLVVWPEKVDYFFIFSLVDPGVQQRLSELAAETLRQLIWAGSRIPFAKLEYVEFPEGQFAATSECSTVTVDGVKLHRRMEACAKLASLLEGVLVEAMLIHSR